MNNTTTLNGFDGDMEQQTDGTGNKIIHVKTASGATAKIRIKGAHLVKTAHRDLLSMGKRLLEGYAFYFGAHGEGCYCQLPNGKKVDMLLGDDGIPILPHSSVEAIFNFNEPVNCNNETAVKDDAGLSWKKK